MITNTGTMTRTIRDWMGDHAPHIRLVDGLFEVSDEGTTWYADPEQYVAALNTDLTLRGIYLSDGEEWVDRWPVSAAAYERLCDLVPLVPQQP